MWNFTAICNKQFSQSCADSFINTTTVLLLQSPYYNINDGGVSVSNLILYSQIYNLFYDLFAGALHDIVGRRAMTISAYFGMSLSFFLYPHAGNVFPNLLLIRILFEHCMVTITTVPLIPDYIKQDSRGKAVAFAFMFSAIGAVSGILVFFGFTRVVSFGWAFAIIGIVYSFFWSIPILCAERHQKRKA